MGKISLTQDINNVETELDIDFEQTMDKHLCNYDLEEIRSLLSDFEDIEDYNDIDFNFEIDFKVHGNTCSLDGMDIEIDPKQLDFLCQEDKESFLSEEIDPKQLDILSQEDEKYILSNEQDSRRNVSEIVEDEDNDEEDEEEEEEHENCNVTEHTEEDEEEEQEQVKQEETYMCNK